MSPLLGGAFLRVSPPLFPGIAPKRANCWIMIRLKNCGVGERIALVDSGIGIAGRRLPVMA
jgi:hypothetical protein